MSTSMMPLYGSIGRSIGGSSGSSGGYLCLSLTTGRYNAIALMEMPG